MAVTQNTYTGNGSTVLYSFTFPYLEESDIKVSLNGTLTTAYTLANATTVQFNTAPTNGAGIVIYRDTDNTALVAEFYPGSAIRAQDLNNDFTQGLYIAQESRNTSDSAKTSATAATATANTALSQSSAAVSTANTASTNASAAVSTANTASTNASAAVSTANTASSNASTAVTTANNAVTTANTKGDAAIASAASANTTAASAVTTANAATSTANTASTNAAAAVATANTASSNASAAVSTANTASTNAATAVTTANSAVSTANAATTTATNANSKADQAIAAVASSINYTLVANVAAIPASPANNTYIEISNSTGLQSFTPLVGLPGGFVGDSGLTVRLVYQTSNTSWNWLTYFANNSETRYLKLAGGTLTGGLILAGAPSSGLQATTKTYVDTADATLTTAAAAAQSTANTGVANAAAAQSTANTAVTNAAAAQTTANAAVVRSGDTMTGALGVTAGTAGAPSLFVSGSTNTGLYSPGSGQLAISTNGTGRLFVDSSGRVGLGTSSPGVALDVGGTNATVRTNETTGYTGYFVSSTGGSIFIGRDNSTGGLLGAGGYSAALWNYGNYPTVFGTNNSEKMRLDSSGRLGLGTSSWSLNSVSTQLGINTSGTTGDGIALFSGQAVANQYLTVGTQYGPTNANNSSQIRFGIDSTGDTFSMIAFATSNGAGTLSEKMRLDRQGRLGIGTTSPLAPLAFANTAGTAGDPSKIALYSAAGIPIYGFGVSAAQLDYVTGESHVFYSRTGSTSTERIRIDGSGRLLVGTSTARTAAAYGAAGFQVESTHYANSSISAINNQATSDGSALMLGKSRGTSNGSNTIVQSGDTTGYISFQGTDGTALLQTAAIISQVDGTPGANDMPGRLVFSTTADGASSPTERFRISNDGSFSSVIPGGSTLYPRFGCRAWVNFNGTGTVAIRGSGNVSSITDHGVGAYTINFTTAMPDVNYTLTGTAGQNGTGIGALAIEAGTTAPTTTTVRIFTRNFSNNPDDFIYNGVAIFR